MSSRKSKNILSPKEFVKRVIKYAAFSISLLVISLGIGTLGYHFIGDLN